MLKKKKKFFLWLLWINNDHIYKHDNQMMRVPRQAFVKSFEYLHFFHKANKYLTLKHENFFEHKINVNLYSNYNLLITSPS